MAWPPPSYFLAKLRPKIFGRPQPPPPHPYLKVLVGYMKNNLDVANTLNLDSTTLGAPKVPSSPL